VACKRHDCSIYESKYIYKNMSFRGLGYESSSESSSDEEEEVRYPKVRELLKSSRHVSPDTGYLRLTLEGGILCFVYPNREPEIKYNNVFGHDAYLSRVVLDFIDTTVADNWTVHITPNCLQLMYDREAEKIHLNVNMIDFKPA